MSTILIEPAEADRQGVRDAVYRLSRLKLDLNLTEGDFRRVKDALLGYTGPVHSTSLYTRGLPADPVGCLSALRDKVLEYRRNITDLERQLAATREPVYDSLAYEQADTLRVVKSIRIDADDIEPGPDDPKVEAE